MTISTKSVASLTRLCCLLALAGLLSAGSSSVSRAATVTWGGANANWNTNSSWVGSVKPVNGDSVLFTSVGTGTNSVVNMSVSLVDITFNNTVNRTFTLANNVSGTTTLGSIINDSNFVQNINTQLNLANSGTFNTGSAGIVLNSKLSGAANISKTGSGVLDITNASNAGYTGTLTVNAGSVKITGGIENANVVVNNGGTLIGSNNYANGYAGSITVNSGGTLSPGDNGYGAFQVTNDTSLAAGSTTNMGVGSIVDFDQIATQGTTTFGGALNIAMNYEPDTFGTNPAVGFLDGDSWNLFSSSTAFAGNFSTVSMTGVYGNVTFVSQGDRWVSTYLGSGRQFEFYVSGPNAGILYAVPEPSTIALAGVGAAVCGLTFWRRRRSAV